MDNVEAIYPLELVNHFADVDHLNGMLEDLHYSDVANTQVKKGILSCDILLKPKFPGIDPIVIHAIDKNKAFDVDAIITAGIRDAANVQGGRYTQ